MKLKVFLAGLAIAGLAVSSAVAAPPDGKGNKHDTTGPNCKPQITVVLKGTLVGTPGTSASSISVNVKSGNHWGAAYVKTTQPLSVGVNKDTTKVRRQGGKTLGDLKDKDRVLVQARVCKQDLKDGKTVPLTASKVIAHPEKAEKDNKDENDNG